MYFFKRNIVLVGEAVTIFDANTHSLLRSYILTGQVASLDQFKSRPTLSPGRDKGSFQKVNVKNIWNFPSVRGGLVGSFSICFLQLTKMQLKPF